MLNKNQIKKIVHWLLPQACVLCGDRIHATIALCINCKHSLPWLTQVCIQCALPLQGEMQISVCGNCLYHPPAYDQILALFHYQAPINKLISGLKFHNKLLHAKILSHLMLEKLVHVYQEQTWPDYIIPVPLHKKRLRERGYNQALELARPLAKAIKKPLLINTVERIRETVAQTTLPAADRQLNVKRAFQLNPKFIAKHVAIVDDVVTTGSTVNELSLLLRKAGVGKIDIWCCARVNT